MIRIKRDQGYVDRFRDYKVVLDGSVIGTIKNGQEREFHLSPGKYAIYIKIDWCRSNTVEIEIDQDIVAFTCGSNLRGIKAFLSVIYIIFLPHRYLWLQKH